MNGLHNYRTYTVRAERRCIYCRQPVTVGTVAARFLGGRAHVECANGVKPAHVSHNRRITVGQSNMRGKAVLPDGNTVTYRDYLASSVWRARRAAFLSGRSGLCEICRTSPVVDVHHKSYRTLGWELDHHLAGLCRECHVDLTAAVADAGWWRNWDITQTWIRNGKPEQTEGNDG